MNNISFVQPNGFPLEADGTLGFMQSDYQGGINALARALGGDYVIVSGCENNGSTYTAGWVVVGGEFLRFEGGAVGTACYIAQTIVPKPNADGTLVDRYFTRSVKMGAGAGSSFGFYQFTRMDSLLNANKALRAIVFEQAVILSGCTVNGFNETTQTVDIGFGYAYIEGVLKLVPSYSGAYPAYYDGVSWGVEPVVNALSFTPFTSQYYADVLSRQVAKIGEVRTFVALSSDFDSDGLGRWSYLGWAVCNGDNGTINMGGRAMIGIDPNSIYTEGSTGGESEATLTIPNMPEHNHQQGQTGSVPVNGLGLIYRSSSSLNQTVSGADNVGGGNEPNVVTTPQSIPLEGSGSPFSIMQPYQVVVFAQRI